VNRVAAAVGLALVALGLAIFGWKAFVYDLPVLPTDPEGLWRVELDVTVRGIGGRGSVRAPVPSTALRPGSHRRALFRRSSALHAARKTAAARRLARRLDGVHDIAYGFRVRLAPVETPLPDGSARRRRDRAALRRSGEFPMDAPRSRRRCVARAAAERRRGPVRLIYAMVAHEVATTAGGSDDALLALANRAGSERGKTALLVTLLRAPACRRVPSRTELGGLGAARDPVGRSLGGRRLGAAFAHGAFFAARPASLCRAARGLVRERRGDRRRSRHLSLRSVARASALRRWRDDGAGEPRIARCSRCTACRWTRRRRCACCSRCR
jgi:hypothetical protein